MGQIPGVWTEFQLERHFLCLCKERQQEQFTNQGRSEELKSPALSMPSSISDAEGPPLS